MNPIDYELDVLASGPDEISRITSRLNEHGYTVVRNLGYIHPSKNKSRRFHAAGTGWRPAIAPVLIVSEAFPQAIFLLTYYDLCWSYSGECVIYGGREIRGIHDGEQKAQSLDWALLDIFAPFRAEYENNLEVGSLWREWLDDIVVAANELKEATGAGLSFEKLRDVVHAEEDSAVCAVEEFLKKVSGRSNP
jgi:hypothetical protein